MSNGMNEKGKAMNDLDMSQYRKDARGALVPVAAIKEIDLLRDDLVRELVAKVLPVKAELATLNPLNKKQPQTPFPHFQAAL